MTTLYSSTFLTMILAFLILLGQNGQEVVIMQDAEKPAFQTIIEAVGPSLETPNEKIRVEIFNSFGCQECDNFGVGTLPELYQHYLDDERVELYLYLVPNMNIEGQLYAARGAHCASEHERFWETVYELHKTEELSEREVDITGQGLNLPVLGFRDCIKSDRFDAKIQEDIDYAEQKGIQTLPSLMVKGTMMIGAQPLENIEREVNKLLKPIN